MTLLNNILPEQRRGKLKALLAQGRLARVMEAHNGLSGIVANNARIEGVSAGDGEICREFDAIWESSLTDSASKGHPDIEVVSFDSRLHTIQEILAVTNKPMIVDGDTGGDANGFEYMVTKLERAGVSVVVIEDKVFPKRNSLEAGTQQTLEDPEAFANKIRRGKKAQITSDFMIVARIESLIAGVGMEDALARARVYLQAGADGILIHSKAKEPDEILEFARRYRDLRRELKIAKPLACVPTTYNNIYEEELQTAGFDIIIYANHLLRSAYKAMVETAKTVLLHQRSFEADPWCAPVREIFQTVGFLDVKEKDLQAGSINPVIVPAAGEEVILKSILGGKPKAMLEIAGKTMLQRQVTALNHCGLTDITVVTGYAAEKMRAENAVMLENKDYNRGSMLHSLMVAKEKMAGGFVMLYADVLLEDNIVAKLLRCREDIVLVVDNALQYHKHEIKKNVDFVVSRNKHQNTHRKINFVYENIVSRIGGKVDPDEATHEFIGLAKFSKTGAEQFMRIYEDCAQLRDGDLRDAKSFSKWSFTDLMQEMVDRGFVVHFIEIHKGWLEIHNPEDIELANKMF